MKLAAIALFVSIMVPAGHMVYGEMKFRAEMAAMDERAKEQNRLAMVEFCKFYYEWRASVGDKGVESVDNQCFEHQEMVP